MFLKVVYDKTLNLGFYFGSSCLNTPFSDDSLGITICEPSLEESSEDESSDELEEEFSES